MCPICIFNQLQVTCPKSKYIPSALRVARLKREFPFNAEQRQSFFYSNNIMSRVGKWYAIQKTVSPLDPRQRHLNLHNYKQEKNISNIWGLLPYFLSPKTFQLSPYIQKRSCHPIVPLLWMDCSRNFVN